MARPPFLLVSLHMQIMVVEGAQGDGKFIAHLASQRSWLGDAQVMGLRWRPAAHEAGLARDELQVMPISQTPGLRQRENTFVNALRLRDCTGRQMDREKHNFAALALSS